MAKDPKYQPKKRKPTKTFLTSPSKEDLMPTPREQILFGILWDWKEQSRRSLHALGEFDYSTQPAYSS